MLASVLQIAKLVPTLRLAETNFAIRTLVCCLRCCSYIVIPGPVPWTHLSAGSGARDLRVRRTTPSAQHQPSPKPDRTTGARHMPQESKRFYRTASMDGAPPTWRVLLEGKPVRTPARREMAVPARALAEAL